MCCFFQEGPGPVISRPVLSCPPKGQDSPRLTRHILSCPPPLPPRRSPPTQLACRLEVTPPSQETNSHYHSRAKLTPEPLYANNSSLPVSRSPSPSPSPAPNILIVGPQSQLSIPVSQSYLLSPATTSSEPVSPLSGGYNSDPTSLAPSPSPCPPTRPLHSYQNTLLSSEPTLPTDTQTCFNLDLVMAKKRFLGCDGPRAVVSYENINVDQINYLCNEGFAKAAVIRALLISRNNINLARDILQVNQNKLSLSFHLTSFFISGIFQQKLLTSLPNQPVLLMSMH